MNANDYNAFVEMLNGVAELKNKSLTTAAIGLWFKVLEKYDYAAIEQAMFLFLQNPDNGQFMPQPADLIRMMGGTTADKALQAWAKVDRAVRTTGPYQTVDFGDKLIHAVISDMGGWVKLCEKNEKEWPFVAKEFENRYRGYKTVPQSIQSPEVCIGISDHLNAQHGFVSQELVALDGKGNPKFLPKPQNSIGFSEKRIENAQGNGNQNTTRKHAEIKKV